MASRLVGVSLELKVHPTLDTKIQRLIDHITSAPSQSVKVAWVDGLGPGSAMGTFLDVRFLSLGQCDLPPSANNRLWDST
ncbi:hypothetical protein RRG08_044698 [Elysia crispata]|uniref:Uncharacterized protein n=1 Tax=Elysia crispata TaxID=231223 RepID=A0AAE1DPP0_9GAST|nr:hypothetical protein RRG08_044698 [Elysia crispata]